MHKIAPYGKAITGAIIALLSYLQPAVDDGLTAAEWIGAAVAFFTAGAVVWAIPNKDPEAEHQDESVQPPSRSVDSLTLDDGATSGQATAPARGWGQGIRYPEDPKTKP